MPSFDFTSPEGKKYTIDGPEGATKEQAFQILQGQLQSKSGKIPSPEPMGAGERFMTGMGDPLVGGKQLLTHIKGTPEEIGKVDLAVKKREQDIQAREGGGIVRGLGAATTTAPLMAAGAAGLAGPVAGAIGAAVGGAGQAAVQPTVVPPKSSFLEEKTQEMLMGGAFGAGGSLALSGLGTAIAPMLRPEAKALSEKGVQLTPGQMTGGIIRRAEEAFKSIPILGSFVRAAEERGIKGFNNAVINQALEPISAKLDPATTAGHEAISEARTKIGAAYDTLLPQLNLTMDQDLSNDLHNIRFTASELPPNINTQFEKILNNRLAIVFTKSPQPGVQGQALKQSDSALRHLSSTYKRSPDADQQAMGARIDEVRQAVRQALIRQNGAAAQDLKKIDYAYSMLTRVEGAGARRATSAGVFTPNDLLQTIKSRDKSARKGAFARGDALMQTFAEYGQAVLPGKLPDTGTTERYLYDALIMTAAGLAEQGHISPEAAIGLAAGAVPYTRPAIGAMNAVARPGPTRAAAGKLVRGAASPAGIGAVPAEEQIYGGPQQ